MYIQAVDCDGVTVHNLWFVLNQDGTIETSGGTRTLPFYFRDYSGRYCLKVESGNATTDTLGSGTIATGYTEEASCEACDADNPPEVPCPPGVLKEYWIENAAGDGMGGWVPSDERCGRPISICADSNPLPEWTVNCLDADAQQVANRYNRGVNPSTPGLSGCCSQSGPPSIPFTGPSFPSVNP